MKNSTRLRARILGLRRDAPEGPACALYDEALALFDRRNRELSMLAPQLWAVARDDFELGLWHAVECFYAELLAITASTPGARARHARKSDREYSEAVKFLLRYERLR
jgi:hypothetical protein